MWWKICLVVLAAMLMFFAIGLYAGGAAFLLLTHSPLEGLVWRTLIDAAQQPLNARQLMYLPWCWGITAALTFLPVGMTVLALLLRVKPKVSLYGDARFANESELKQFEYTGEYQ